MHGGQCPRGVRAPRRPPIMVLGGALVSLAAHLVAAPLVRGPKGSARASRARGARRAASVQPSGAHPCVCARRSKPSFASSACGVVDGSLSGASHFRSRSPQRGRGAVATTARGSCGSDGRAPFWQPRPSCPRKHRSTSSDQTRAGLQQGAGQSGQATQGGGARVAGTRFGRSQDSNPTRPFHRQDVGPVCMRRPAPEQLRDRMWRMVGLAISAEEAAGSLCVVGELQNCRPIAGMPSGLCQCSACAASDQRGGEGRARWCITSARLRRLVVGGLGERSDKRLSSCHSSSGSHGAPTPERAAARTKRPRASLWIRRARAPERPWLARARVCACVSCRRESGECPGF